MPIIAKHVQDFAPAPVGSFPAVCTLVAELGLQPGFEGRDHPVHQIFVQFELTGEPLPDRPGENYVIGRRYKLSLHKRSALYQLLVNWRGRMFTDEELAQGFDLSRILGRPALLSISHETSAQGDTRAVIAGISRIPAGLGIPPTSAPPLIYALDEPRPEVFSQLPAWIQKVISERIAHRIAQPAQGRAPEPLSMTGYHPGERPASPIVGASAGAQQHPGGAAVYEALTRNRLGSEVGEEPF